jgi:hypothetical protein
MLLADEIRSHVEQHIGPIRQILDGDAGETSPVRLLYVAPHEMRPVHTLITLGISGQAMNVPSEKEAPRYIELTATLPKQWQFDPDSLKQDRWAWPLRLVKSLAQRAHMQGEWLAWGQMIANGEPPQPYAQTTKQCAALIVPSLLVPTAFYQLVTPTRSIEFYGVVPLYREEWQFGRDRGVESLMNLLIDRDVNDVVDPKRRNATKKRFIFF